MNRASRREDLTPMGASVARRLLLGLGGAVAWLLLAGGSALASDTDIAVPDLDVGTFIIAGKAISAWWLLFWGACVIGGTLGISLYLRTQIHKLPAHKSMLDIAE